MSRFYEIASKSGPLVQIIRNFQERLHSWMLYCAMPHRHQLLYVSSSLTEYRNLTLEMNRCYFIAFLFVVFFFLVRNGSHTHTNWCDVSIYSGCRHYVGCVWVLIYKRICSVFVLERLISLSICLDLCVAFIFGVHVFSVHSDVSWLKFSNDGELKVARKKSVSFIHHLTCAYWTEMVSNVRHIFISSVQTQQS